MYLKRMLEAKANFFIGFSLKVSKTFHFYDLLCRHVGRGEAGGAVKRTKSKTFIFIVRVEFPDSENIFC